MKTNQHTLLKAVSFTGIGLHTGEPVNLTILPAAINHGYKFQRVDLEGQPIIEADADLVVDTSRGTTLEKNGVRVYTTEHVLAALVGLEIDNALIQIDAPEIPIMDGSAIQFIDAIEESGLERQNAIRNFFDVTECISFSNEDKKIDITALPLNDYRLTVMVDYNSSVLGSQHANLSKISKFKSNIAPCRTFCFFHEIEALYKAGLIKGGNLDNAIVLVDREVQKEELDRVAEIIGKSIEVKEEGILNNIDLRFQNEPARHKLLDVIGDLALIGRPLRAQILAARPGHASNVAFAKKIKAAMRKAQTQENFRYHPDMPTVLDSVQLKEMLPHRFPFLMVDKIFHLDETMVAGMKNLTANEAFFEGHFPNNPVMPGVLQVEGLAQTGGMLVLNSVPDPENYWTYFLRIDKCRFRKMVVPGDTIVYRAILLGPIKRGIAKMKGTAFVNGELVCEAELTASIVKKT